MAITKAFESTETRLKRLKQRCKGDPDIELKWLMPIFDIKGLTSWFHLLDGTKASGIDGVTKREYGENLQTNLQSLLEQMKGLSYRPGAVREVLIPKGDGKMRPLGICNLEDKIVQTGMAKVLEAIYEPMFYDFSYGFRPGRSCHAAIKDLHKYLYKNRCDCVIDVDIRNFFGSIRHEILINLIGGKIADEVFLRYVSRTLKAGVLRGDQFAVSDEGTPQGSPVSPVLANIFAHYVIDRWFVEMAKPVMRGRVHMVRYADDLVICCELASDASRILTGLKNRLKKFGLEVNGDKTKIVHFDRNGLGRGERQESFDFLGFTWYIGKSLKGGFPLVKVKTSRKRLSAKLRRVREWMSENRHRHRLVTLWTKFRRKLDGHIRYYGVSFNQRNVGSFINSAVKIFFKWINRRSQKRSINWDKFNKFVERYPLPETKTYVYLF
jgi:group II intron reverse transcriptase/maturase